MNQNYIRRFIQVIEVSNQNVVCLCRLEQTDSVAAAGLKNILYALYVFYSSHFMSTAHLIVIFKKSLNVFIY